MKVKSKYIGLNCHQLKYLIKFTLLKKEKHNVMMLNVSPEWKHFNYI